MVRHTKDVMSQTPQKLDSVPEMHEHHASGIENTSSLAGEGMPPAPASRDASHDALPPPPQAPPAASPVQERVEITRPTEETFSMASEDSIPQQEAWMSGREIWDARASWDSASGHEEPSSRRTFRERRVPSSSIARAWGFGALAARMATNAAGSWLGRRIGWSAKEQAPGGQDGDSEAAEEKHIDLEERYRADEIQGSSPKPPLTAASTEPPSSSSSAPASPKSSSSSSSTSSSWMSEGQANMLASGLCRMRGAALKLGQMVSLQDESLVPRAVADVLERVRAQADVMPRRQLAAVMRQELGPDWKANFGGDWRSVTDASGKKHIVGFDEHPVAAASIGQVHRAVLPDGTRVAVKVQYPGVAESIDSDLNNLKRLITFAVSLPPGLHLDSAIAVAREELKLECDYKYEAAAQRRFGELLDGDGDFVIPQVMESLSSKQVLTSTWLDGVPIDKCAALPEPLRNDLAFKLLRVTLRELFEFRFMQTDPNWGNFLYDPSSRRIGLLDFGAAKEFPREFVDDYLRLVWSAAERDRDAMLEASLRLGFLTGHESAKMLQAHTEAGMLVGEPFTQREPFDFRGSGITARIGKYGSTFAQQRLTPPPRESYSLHRKLSGAFLICIRLGATIPCRELLERAIAEYTFTTPPLEHKPQKETIEHFLRRERDGPSAGASSPVRGIRGYARANA